MLNGEYKSSNQYAKNVVMVKNDKTKTIQSEADLKEEVKRILERLPEITIEPPE
jgi:hypothetical protein